MLLKNFNGFIPLVYENLCIEYILKNYDLIVAECKYSNKK